MKKNKKLKLFINSSVVIAASVIIIVLLNSLLVAFDSKIPLEISLKRDEIYELTDESIDIAKKINDDTTITILYNGEATEDMRLLTDICKLYSAKNEKIKLETLDFVNNPTALTSYSEAIKSITNPNYAMIFSQGDRFDVAESTSYISTDGQSNIERVITNKLAVFVDGFKISSITMTTGHGEKTNYGFEAVLQMYNYNLKVIDLLKEDIPTDEKTLLIINSPTGDFSKEEIDKLDKFLDYGGNVQIYFDPLASNEELPRLEEYLYNEWAIKRNHSIVVDIDNRLESADEASAIYGLLSIAELYDNEIVSPIKQSKRDVLYSTSNLFEIASDKPATLEITPVLKTSGNAYLKDIATINEIKNIKDITGSFDILLSASRTNYTLDDEIFTGKLIVSGSSYTMDTLIGDTRFANEDLLINSINWMRGSEAGITVRTKDLPQGYMTIPNAAFWPWFICLIIVIPIGISIGGFIVWLKRRYK